MTGPLTRFMAGADRKAWRPVMVFLVLGAITQGIGFATAVPIVDGLLGDGGRIAWGWTAVLVAVTVVHSVLHHRSVPMCNELGADLVVDVTRSIDRRVAALPNRSLRPEHADRLGTLSGYSVVVLMGLPAHVLRPLVAAVVTPLTVIVVIAFVEPLLAVVVAGGSLVVAVVTWLAIRLLVAAGDLDGAHWLDRIPARWSQTPPSRVVRLAAGDVLPWRLLELLNCVAVVACVALASGGTSPAMAVALIVLSVLMVRPMMEAVLLTSTVLNSHDVLRRIEPLTGTDDPVPTGMPWPAACDVEFAGVESAGVGTTVSFRLPANSTTAVVGAPDGLRLTLSDLLVGDALPTAGSVRIGGVEITDLAPDEVAARVARVSATSPDLTVTEAERLIETASEHATLALPKAQEELARLRDAVAAGTDLVEADRWRLALLRAVAQEPAVVIVDATAGASVMHDDGLVELLDVLRRDRTCWLLWGPGSAQPECDQVLVVDGGSVTPGTAEEGSRHIRVP
ncbi:ABC-type transport system involved in cytochrome bd biosynthesis fused ATPase/permease subunit [Kibdelosporangium banguiense]|uniref:ABC-type transport system involved in cytochrome bd biosynthesis fused ATPase/permease subunit n=1 Tax=Kibdelosporangium banguiense TaxID=1365924 RepID=A0ABS4TXP6_9PSEU|nr:hypothetical protein [Kibdelosporangium banguiense]MBP2329143.1 ABC-type transport system involved in cytochrome bd biosynthesis fused ATPase/permease subunit [Kibdelosporangium banguiense]